MNTNLSKRQLMEDYRTIRDALKKSGYNPDRIIKEYREKYGDREVLTREMKDPKLRPGAKALFDKYATLTDKACGNF